MLDEVLASHCRQLRFGWMVDGCPADDLLEKRGSVLCNVVSEISLRRVRSEHEHVGESRQRVTHFAEEFVFGTDRASVLSGGMHVRFDSLDRCVLGVELKDLRFVVIDVEGRAEGRH